MPLTETSSIALPLPSTPFRVATAFCRLRSAAADTEAANSSGVRSLRVGLGLAVGSAEIVRVLLAVPADGLSESPQAAAPAASTATSAAGVRPQMARPRKGRRAGPVRFTNAPSTEAGTGK